MAVSKKIGPSSAIWGSFIFVSITLCWASQAALVVKSPSASSGAIRDVGSISGSGRSPWRRAWPPSPVFSPGESHGQSSLVGYKVAESWTRLSGLAHTHAAYRVGRRKWRENTRRHTQPSGLPPMGGHSLLSRRPPQDLDARQWISEPHWVVWM